MLRYVQYYREAKLRHPPVGFGEFGSDRGSDGKEGWLEWADHDRMLASFAECCNRLRAEPWVEFLAYFSLGTGGNPKWKKLDLLESRKGRETFRRLCQDQYDSRIVDASSWEIVEPPEEDGPMQEWLEAYKSAHLGRSPEEHEYYLHEVAIGNTPTTRTDLKIISHDIMAKAEQLREIESQLPNP